MCARGAGLMGVIKGPAPFSGVAEECNGFLLQCSLYIENQPHLYTTERSKVSFLISLLSGKALQWAETIWAQAGNITQSFDNFVSHFREVLDGHTVIPPQVISFITSAHQGVCIEVQNAHGCQQLEWTLIDHHLPPRIRAQTSLADGQLRWQLWLGDYDPTFHSLLLTHAIMRRRTNLLEPLHSLIPSPRDPFPSRTRIRTHANWGNAVGTRWVAEVTI